MVLWGLFAVWRRRGKQPYRAAGWSFVLAAILDLAANLVLSRLLETAPFKLWDLLETAVLLAAAAGCFYFDRIRH